MKLLAGVCLGEPSGLKTFTTDNIELLTVYTVILKAIALLYK